MRDPDDLCTVHAEPSGPDRPVLVHALSGFLDAGGAGRLAAEHLLATREHRLIATFDTDDLLDYRARRPRMTFLSDHFASVDIPEITVHEVVDDAGVPFLLMVGPEPDYQWRRFVAAVEGLVDRFDVRLTVSLAAVPWPAPHTRPIGLTVHGTEAELLAGYTPMVGALEVPGHVAGMLELHLGETGHAAMGLAAHVPHYLAQFDYPRAAMVLLDALGPLTGLVLPAAGLAAAAGEAEAEVAAQLAGSPEFVAVVTALEEQYDQLLAQRAAGAAASAALAPGGSVPTGDEIAAQVEQFLAGMQAQRDDDQG